MLAGLLLLMAVVSGMSFVSIGYLGAYYKQKKLDETVRHWQVTAEWGSGVLTLLLIYLFVLELIKKGDLCILG